MEKFDSIDSIIEWQRQQAVIRMALFYKDLKHALRFDLFVYLLCENLVSFV